MLLNNESLEESIEEQRIEYEDRISELESLLKDKSLITNEDDVLISLRKQHKAALNTIAKVCVLA